jgi:hypothetical protein
MLDLARSLGAGSPNPKGLSIDARSGCYNCHRNVTPLVTAPTDVKPLIPLPQFVSCYVVNDVTGTQLHMRDRTRAHVYIYLLHRNIVTWKYIYRAFHTLVRRFDCYGLSYAFFVRNMKRSGYQWLSSSAAGSDRLQLGKKRLRTGAQGPLGALAGWRGGLATGDRCVDAQISRSASGVSISREHWARGCNRLGTAWSMSANPHNSAVLSRVGALIRCPGHQLGTSVTRRRSVRVGSETCPAPPNHCPQTGLRPWSARRDETSGWGKPYSDTSNSCGAPAWSLSEPWAAEMQHREPGYRTVFRAADQPARRSDPPRGR